MARRLKQQIMRDKSSKMLLLMVQYTKQGVFKSPNPGCKILRDKCFFQLNFARLSWVLRTNATRWGNWFGYNIITRMTRQLNICKPQHKLYQVYFNGTCSQADTELRAERQFVAARRRHNSWHTTYMSETTVWQHPADSLHPLSATKTLKVLVTLRR